MEQIRFEINDYEIITPINYAGHKLYKHAVDALNSSGNDYIEYLNTKHYRISEYSDLTGAFLRGITWAEKANLDLIGNLENSKLENEVLDCYKNSPKNVENSFSQKMIEKIRENIISFGIEDDEKREFEIE